MPPVNLQQIFGLVQKRTYWREPFNPKDCYATEIDFGNLPSQLATEKMAVRFANILKASGVNIPVLPAVTDVAKNGVNESGLLFAFENYVSLAVIGTLERVINVEIRRLGLIPNYSINVSADEQYQDAIRSNDDPPNPMEPS